MKKRFINGDSFLWIAEKSCQVKRMLDFENGYISKIEIIKVHEKVVIGDICYADSGYEWYVFLPDNKNWCLTFMYDNKKDIIEWYFDITYKNGISDEGIPFYYDLYLDIAVYPDSTVVLLDEDDLEAALAANGITKEMYETAYSARKQILESQFVHMDFLFSMSSRIKSQFFHTA